MEYVNVLVTDPIDEAGIRRIREVSGRVRATHISDLTRAEQRGDRAAEDKLNALLAEAEIVCGFILPRDVIRRAPKLKWLQMLSTGVDAVVDGAFLESQVVMSKVDGVHSHTVAEFAFAMVLMFAKKMPFCFEQKRNRQWQQYTPSVLRSKTMGIVGLGHVGRSVARIAKAFDMRVVATRRSAKGAGRARDVDLVLPSERLHELLAESDFVALTLPLTGESKEMIGEAELRAMKPTAYLINVARGPIVNEEVLVRALDEGWIGGAGLDVFTSEPLPADSRLWELPNVIYSPHVAGYMEGYGAGVTELFLENLRRYLGGERLLNTVSKKKGY